MAHANDANQQVSGDDRRARRNVVVLSIAQALYMTGAAIQITLSGLVGYLLAVDKSLATFPITAYVLGTLVSTMPASMFMRHVGRRRGFQFGALMGLASAILAVYAIYELSFWLFCFAMMLAGTYQAFAQYYRVAAADTASDDFRPKASGKGAGIPRIDMTSYPACTSIRCKEPKVKSLVWVRSRMPRFP